VVESIQIDDKEWAEFVDFWKKKWQMTTPNRESVELFLQWRECKLKNIDWQWSFK